MSTKVSREENEIVAQTEQNIYKLSRLITIPFPYSDNNAVVTTKQSLNCNNNVPSQLADNVHQETQQARITGVNPPLYFKA